MEVAFNLKWKTGETVREESIMATSSSDAVSRVRMKSPYAKILDVSFDFSGTIKTWAEKSGGTMPDNEAAQVAKHLAMVLESGRDAQKAVKMIQTLTSDKSIISRLKKVSLDLDKGSRLSEALVSHGFPKETMMILANGESTGQLPGVLRGISEMLKLRMSLREELKKVSMQPAFAMLVIFGLVIVIVFWLIPEYAGMMKDMPGIRISKVNKELFDWDLAIVQHAGLILTTGLGLLTGLVLLVIRPEFREGLGALLGKLSRTIGTLRAAIVSYKFVTTMKTVTIAGIPAIKALDEMKTFGAGRETAIYRMMFVEMNDRSLSLAEAARKTGVFLPFISDSIAMALESGKLAEEFGELEKNTKELITENLEKVKAAIPLITVSIMAIIVTGAGLALYGPLFSVITNFLSQRAG